MRPAYSPNVIHKAASQEAASTASLHSPPRRVERKTLARTAAHSGIIYHTYAMEGQVFFLPRSDGALVLLLLTTGVGGWRKDIHSPWSCLRKTSET